MNSKLASHKHIFFKVKVILNKVKINNPWIDFGVDMLNEMTGLNVSAKATQNILDYFGR